SGSPSASSIVRQAPDRAHVTRIKRQPAAEVRELEDLRTVGTATARWLRAVGIPTVAELRHVGAVEAFGRIAYRFGKAVNRNLLYALEGALQDRPYNSFSESEKRRLCARAGLPFSAASHHRGRTPD